MKVKKGQNYKSGKRIIKIISRAKFDYWNVKAGKKNHRIHEGTLDKFYKLL